MRVWERVSGGQSVNIVPFVLGCQHRLHVQFESNGSDRLVFNWVFCLNKQILLIDSCYKCTPTNNTIRINQWLTSKWKKLIWQYSSPTSHKLHSRWWLALVTWKDHLTSDSATVLFITNINCFDLHFELFASRPHITPYYKHLETSYLDLQTSINIKEEFMLICNVTTKIVINHTFLKSIL